MDFAVHVYLRNDHVASDITDFHTGLFEHFLCALVRLDPLAACVFVVKLLAILVNDHFRDSALDDAAGAVGAGSPWHVELAAL